MSEALVEQIRKLVAEQLGVDRNQVTSQASILNDLGADSLAIVELVLALEESFDIKIPDDEVDSIKTVGDAFMATDSGAPRSRRFWTADSADWRRRSAVPATMSND